MNSTELRAEIARLQAVLKNAAEEERAEAQAAFDAIERGWEYRATLKGIELKIECRPDTATCERLDAFREKYPGFSPRLGSMRQSNDWHGMSGTCGRSIDGRPFLARCAGSIVIVQPSHWELLWLTEDQLAQFIAGEVPVELRKPW